MADLLPKKETTSSSFLQKYPTFDGRGTVIGILDSGIDPGAPGLQVTSDGKPKIIHLFNAGESGNVDTSKVVTAENGTIKGLTGRTLKIPETWTNPSGKFHIGIKSAHILFPNSLRDRTKKEYREKEFDPAHKLAKAAALRELDAFKEKTKDSKNNLTRADKLTQAELQASVDVLASIEKEYKDYGPVYDCIVFHDGKSWQAAIDISEVGNLAETALLGPYSETYKFGTFPHSKLNYVVNIYDDGNLLEIVVPSSAHGTHVASIAAGHFPDDPDRNGIAPGAQLVGIVIGCSFFGTMETCSSLTRAAIKAAELGIDVINMSYGEIGQWNDSPILNLLEDLVNKYGITFCGSAGNAGTGLSTVGTPPTASTDSIIGVGAYVSANMMIAEYSLCQSHSGAAYNFTSRGPTLRGALGPSICAPGAAIASVPNICNASSELFNGTSMASPNAAGCFALLISGLKQEKIGYSTFSLRRAVENTAYKPSSYEPLAMGHGLIQVEKAFEHLKTHRNLVEQDVRFSIEIGGDLGIYQRVAKSDAKPESFSVSIKPVFLNEKDRDASSKIKFNMDLLLICDDPWIEAPKFLNLTYCTRNIPIKVNPLGLPHGLHFSTVRAYDSANIEKGVVFSIPITYVIAETVETSNNLKSDEKFTLAYPATMLQPGQVKRIFVKPPRGASLVQVKVTNLHENETLLQVHMLQLAPEIDPRSYYSRSLKKFPGKDSHTWNFQLIEESILEVDVSKQWSSINDAPIAVELKFAAVRTNNFTTMLAGNGIHRVNLRSFLEPVTITPSVSLNKATTFIKPNESKIRPLGPRDIIADGRQLHEMVITYNFTLPSSVEINLLLSQFKKLLYESEVNAQLVFLFDRNKSYIAAFDSYNSSFVKVEKGTYTARAQIWHESQDFLQKLTNLTLILQQKLPEASSINLNTYYRKREALIKGKKCSQVRLNPGRWMPVYVTGLPDENWPKGVLLNPGSFLHGSFKVTDAVKTVLLNHPFKLVIDALPNNNKKASPDKEPSKNTEGDFQDALLDFKLSWLSKLKGKSLDRLAEDVTSLKAEKDKLAVVNLAKIVALETSNVSNVIRCSYFLSHFILFFSFFNNFSICRRKIKEK